MKWFLASTALFLSTMSAMGSENCRAVPDAMSRLTCYDKTFPPRPAKQAGKVTATPDQQQYALTVGRAFLDAGINIDAYVKTDRSGSGVVYALPALVMMGHMNKVHVHQIQSKLKIIEAASRLDFKTVEFFSKGGPSWIFDLTKTGPTCSIDLCF